MAKENLPLLFGSPNDKAFIDPKDYLEYMKKRGNFRDWTPVVSCILTFNIDWFRLIENRLKLISKVGRGIYIFKHGSKKIVAQNVNVGAAKAGIELETLAGLGVKNFIAIGSAGSIQEKIKVGDLVLATQAIRDEGTSYHYLSPSKYSYPSTKLYKKLKKSLDEINFTFFEGPTWTTDAPYRETVRKLKAYRKEGVLTVEMEAASLFAIAKFRKVNFVSIFNISDELHGTHWNPKFHHKSHQFSKEKLLQAALKALSV